MLATWARCDRLVIPDLDMDFGQIPNSASSVCILSAGTAVTGRCWELDCSLSARYSARASARLPIRLSAQSVAVRDSCILEDRIASV